IGNPSYERTVSAWLLRADRLTAGTGAHVVPDGRVDGVLDEADRAIAEDHVHPPGVVAATGNVARPQGRVRQLPRPLVVVQAVAPREVRRHRVRVERGGDQVAVILQTLVTQRRAGGGVAGGEGIDAVDDALAVGHPGGRNESWVLWLERLARGIVA